MRCVIDHISTFKMGFKNLFVFIALLLAWKVCRVYGQAARVEYINQPCSSSVCSTAQTSPQLVVPAIYSPAPSPYDCCIQESVPTVSSYNGCNGYSNYAPSYPQPMPPIIIDDDDDDNLQQLLYFLLFAMRNKNNCGSGNFGGCSGGYSGGCGCGGCGCGGCSCGGGCNCGCGNNGGCGCGGSCGGNCGGNCGGTCGGNFGGNCGGNCGGGCDNSGCCGCGNCCGYSNNNLGCGCPYFPYPIPYAINGACSCNCPGSGGCSDTSCCCSDGKNQSGQCNKDYKVYINTDPSCCC